MTRAASEAAWTDLGEGMLVRRSAAFQMNSVLLLHSDQAVVVDPGVLPSELDDLARAVREAAPLRVTLFCTHADWDHVLGRPWWPEARAIAHDLFAAEVRRNQGGILEEAQKLSRRHGESWRTPQGAEFEPFRPDHPISGLHFLKLDPWKLVFRDALGHSDSQLSLHLPDQRLLIAADMLSDIEIPTLNRPAAVYRSTLEALAPLAEHGAIGTVVPGHGTIARGYGPVRERFRRDSSYLTALEEGVRQALAQGLDLAATQATLADLGDVERHPEFPMADVHRENIAIEHRDATENASNRTRRSPRPSRGS